MLKAKYLKAATKEYFKGVLSSMKWYIPASVGVIILGAVALQAAEDPDEDPDSNEETPNEESTKEDASVEATCEDENFEKKEKSWFREE